MEPLLLYFLKVNVALILLYGFYRLFFHKDTFLKLRRFSLLAFYAIAISYPLCNLQGLLQNNETITEVVYAYSVMLPEVTVGATKAAPALSLNTLFWGAYLLVFIGLMASFITQLVSIFKIKSKKQNYKGISIHVPEKIETPFSFFRYIFINPKLHSDKELHEILTHEQTHANQWHSVDIIISDLFARLFWINPFSWLLKREVRHNLEYLADRSVITSGHDTKTYQYHLLGLTNQKAAAQLINNFNVLPLKNRIKMMNKKPSHHIRRFKYLLFVPLVALLLVFSNIEVLARVLIEDKAQTEYINEAITSLEIPDTQLATNPIDYDQEPQKDRKKKIYRGVEEMPEFPGGEKDLMKFFNENINYPVTAAENGVQGRVTIEFVVSETGEITNAKVIQPLNPECDTEALRVIQAMPNWKPGKQNGEEVAVYYTIPVTFKLQGDTSKKDSSKEKAVQKEGHKVYRGVEKMPEFPGGEKELMKFLSENIQYPEQALKSNTQGRVTVEFVVTETGEITNAKVIQKLSPETDAEAIRVILSMPEWKPGKQNGKEVSVYYTLPVMFRLEPRKPQIEKEDIQIQILDKEPILRGVDEMPQFPGGDRELMKFINDNTVYPTSTAEKGIQGRVIVELAITETGDITDLKIIQSLDEETDKEALRVVGLMPKWKPGKQDGKAVKVYYTIPITFKLQA